MLRAIVVLAFLCTNAARLLPAEPRLVAHVGRTTIYLDSKKIPPAVLAARFASVEDRFRAVVPGKTELPQRPLTVFAVSDRMTLFRLYPPGFVGRYGAIYRYSDEADYFVVDTNFKNWAAVASHEFAHALVAPRYPEFPRWISEGLAQFLSVDAFDCGTRFDLSRLLQEWSSASLSESSPHEIRNYKASAAFVRWVIQRYGFDAIARIAFRIADGETPEIVLKSVTGLELPQIRGEMAGTCGSTKSEAIRAYSASPRIIATAEIAESEFQSAVIDYQAHTPDHAFEALAHYQSAVVHFPDDSRLMTGMAAAYLHLAKYEYSLHWSQRALAANPADSTARFYVGLLCLQLRRCRLPEALKALQDSMNDFGHVASAHAQVAELLWLLGRENESRLEIERAAELQPGNSAFQYKRREYAEHELGPESAVSQGQYSPELRELMRRQRDVADQEVSRQWRPQR